MKNNSNKNYTDKSTSGVCVCVCVCERERQTVSAKRLTLRSFQHKMRNNFLVYEVTCLP